MQGGNVYSSLENVTEWRPSVNRMIRYVICEKGVTISGILKLYNKLPDDIKRALADSGITVRSIQASTVVDTDGRFNADEIRNNQITEIAA